MDERVYTVRVCAACLTQALAADGLCAQCGGETFEHVRFRVARSQVLKQADPSRSLVERTVYFGCVGEAGHYYWHRGSRGEPYKAGYESVTPWGIKVDGGLFPERGTDLRQGVAHVVHHDDGWTALAFTDQSVDSRGGSWSVYCVPAIIDGNQALEVARAAFPSIFARYTFDVVLAT